MSWHDAWVSIVIRPAEMTDEEALTRIERETWSLHVSPNVYTPRPFFRNARPEEVLVGVLDGEVAGFLCLRPATPLASNAHVLMIAGLGVAPSMQRKGVASGLLEAAETYASERKIERLALRVLSVNTAARALYRTRSVTDGRGGADRSLRGRTRMGQCWGLPSWLRHAETRRSSAALLRHARAGGRTRPGRSGRAMQR